MKPKFTIITVTYNCEDDIEKTIESVISQTYKNYEYIFVDGLSTDTTLLKIKKYSKENNNIRIISEKDDGIYDAMNKGIKMSNGELIFFLNAGDTFYSNDVLERISNQIGNFDIIYGNLICDSKIVYNNFNINKLFFIREKMVCHQSIFASQRCFDNNLFDLNFKVCADRKWLINAYKSKKSFKYIDDIISIYDNNGFSTSKESKALIKRESIEILQKEFGKKVIFGIYIKRILGKIKNKYIKEIKNV